jgi:hypothetical protein
MATGNIRGGKRNYARPGKPTTVTPVASTSTSSISVTLTVPTVGPVPTSYTITPASTTGSVPSAQQVIQLLVLQQ